MRATVSRRTNFAVFILMVLGGFAASLRLRPDANWDLRNYHIYDPYAILHGKLGYDIAPAQAQTFLAPQLDLIDYGLRHFLNHQPGLLNCVMSIPSAIVTFLAFLIASRFIPQAVPARVILAVIVAVIGATGAAALPTLASSSSESIPACFCLAGFLLILAVEDGSRVVARLALAGLLLGIAPGFKLTSAPYCLGAAAAVLAAPIQPFRRKALAFLAFGAAGVAGVLLIAAPWWLTMEARYGSPLFPFLNQVFHSPDYLPLSMSDDRFKPQGALQTIFYPFYWAIDSTPRVTELPMRDPRFAVAFVMTLLAAIGILAARGRRRTEATMFVLMFGVSYILWEAQFSIFRYLSTVEALSAIPLLVAWRVLDPGARWCRAPWVGTIGLGLLCATTITYPNWGHAAHGPEAVAVSAPQLPKNALVIMLDDAPMAYVAAFEPRSVRFVGANSNLLRPGQDSLMAKQAEAAIRSAKGPIWGLEYPPAAAENEQTLHYYGLHRVPPCLTVISNIDGNSLRLCPLQRGN